MLGRGRRNLRGDRVFGFGPLAFEKQDYGLKLIRPKT
jgi:hypothetical protein